MRKRIEKPGTFLADSGLLFEINRLVMHPRGLALFILEQHVEGETSGKPEESIGVFNIRDDPEGVYFGGDMYDYGTEKLQKYDKEQEQWKRDQVRRERLGFVTQMRPVWEKP